MRRLFVLALVLVVAFSAYGVIAVSAEAVQSECGALGVPSVVAGDLNDASLWELGGLSGSGAEYATRDFLRTKQYLADEVGYVYAENDYVFRAVVYDAAGNFLGFWDNKNISATSKSLYYLNPKGLEGYKLRLLCQRLGASTISVAECANIHFLSSSSGTGPVLTFIDDDGSLEALNNWDSICDEVDIDITSALVTNAMGDENDPNRTKASWTDVSRLQEKGFEFVSHTHNHINVLNSSDKTCEADFAASIALLREHGCEYRYLVYPYNATSSTKIGLVKQYFEAAVGLGGTNADPGSDNTLPVYTHWLRRYSINEASATTKVEYNGETVDAHAFKSLDTLKGYIDDAVTNGSWVIIMTHLRNDGSFYHDEASRQMIVELCQYAREKGVQIQTFGEAYSQYKNIAETGNQSIYGNPHYVVDCNGVVHYRGQNEAGHIEETISGKVPNCSESGLTDGVRCAACKEILVPQEEIPVTDEHVYDSDNDAVCNVCYAVRNMVDVFSFEDYRVKFLDTDATHTNPRLEIYKIGDQEVVDPSDEKLLKTIDSKPVTHWHANNINKVMLTDAGNYILLLKYNVPSGAAVRVPLRVTVSSAPKLFVNDNRITVVDDFDANINHRLVAYYLGEETVTDLGDEAALKTIDPAPVTYWGLSRINNLILQKPGNYALLLQYNEGKSAKKTVTMLAQAEPMIEPVISGVGADYKLIVKDEDTSHKYHRATVYYLGEEIVESYDETQMKALDENAATYWGLDRINKAQLREKGNYAVVLHYNLSNGTKQTVASMITIDLEKPLLYQENGRLVAVDTKNQYVNHRATVYYLGEETSVDIYDETALKCLDPTAKTYWGLETINKIALNRSGCYVVVLHYNLPGSSKMTVVAQINA